MEKLGKKKLDMQKLLAPAALVILYIVFSIFGNNFLTLDTVKNILESSYYIGFMSFGVTFIIITGGIGFLVAICLFASVREKLEFADYPESYEGFPICLVSAGLLALAFMGFSGMKIG